MKRIPFNRDWQFGPLVSVHEAIRVAPPSDNLVNLPHDAMLASGRTPNGTGGAPTGYFDGGSWTYEKQFDVPNDWASKRITFEFEGVYRDAMVYINGAFAGQWSNGYSSFYVEADPFLNYGATNTIRVDARSREDSRWYPGAGLYRPVHLLVGELLHIPPTGLRVSTPDVDDELATVVVRTAITNKGAITRTVDLLLEIHNDAGERVATEKSRVTLLPNETLTSHQRTYVKEPSLWSPDTPSLYRATITLHSDTGTVDQASTIFGIRNVSVDPVRGLRLNGKTIKLRGAAVHHDHGVLGAAEFADAAARRVQRMKDAGFNAIRSAHNPISVAMLEACDRLGMLVFDEVFDMWSVSKSTDDYSRSFPEWWERDIDAIVAKDFNHPSVIMYSIGNEIIEAGTRHGARWGRLLAERTREQDPTRIVTHALQGMYMARDKVPELRAEVNQDSSTIRGLNDYLGQVTHLMNRVMASELLGDRLLEPASMLDVVGLNYGDARYEVDQDKYPNRIYFNSESFPTHIDRLWKMVLERNNVLGDFTWTGWDFLGEVGTGRHVYPEDAQEHRAPYPWIAAVCGDIDLIGHRKPISYYREIVFGLTDVPYLAVRKPREDGYVIEPKAWTWSDVVPSWTWEVEAGTPMHVEGYASGDEVQYVLNGEVVATEKVGASRDYLTQATIPYQPGTLEIVSYRNGIEIGRRQLQTADAATKLTLAVDRDTLSANGEDLLHLEIGLVDADDRPNPLAEAEVTVSVEGPAILQGIGSADPASNGNFLGAATATYRGSALAVIRAGDKPGPVTITAKAPGYQDAALVIDSGTAPADGSNFPVPR